MTNLNEESVEEKVETNTEQPPVLSEGKRQLKRWLNRNFRIEMTDGRILIGIFVCTDRDANIILGQCSEYLKAESDEEPRVLGLVMVPGRHIVSIQYDDVPILTYNRNSGSAAE